MAVVNKASSGYWSMSFDMPLRSYGGVSLGVEQSQRTTEGYQENSVKHNPPRFFPPQLPEPMSM